MNNIIISLAMVLGTMTGTANAVDSGHKNTLGSGGALPKATKPATSSAGSVGLTGGSTDKEIDTKIYLKTGKQIEASEQKTDKVGTKKKGTRVTFDGGMKRVNPKKQTIGIIFEFRDSDGRPVSMADIKSGRIPPGTEITGTSQKSGVTTRFRVESQQTAASIAEQSSNLHDPNVSLNKAMGAASAAAVISAALTPVPDFALSFAQAGMTAATTSYYFGTAGLRQVAGNNPQVRLGTRAKTYLFDDEGGMVGGGGGGGGGGGPQAVNDNNGGGGT